MQAVARRWLLAAHLALFVATCTAGPTAPPSADRTPARPAATAPGSAVPATSPPATSPPATSPATTPDPALARLAGRYRCLSRALYYDAGGGAGTGTCQLFPALELGADGRWAWGTSSGAWQLRAATEADWQRWGIAPYGSVSEVVVLDGLGDGPFEVADGVIWVVYHDDAVAGTVWLKWGPAA